MFSDEDTTTLLTAPTFAHQSINALGKLLAGNHISQFDQDTDINARDGTSQTPVPLVQELYGTQYFLISE